MAFFRSLDLWLQIAIIALVVVGAAVAAYYLWKLVVWAWNHIWAWIKRLCRWLKALFARLCWLLLPYPRSALKALIYIVLVLIASLAAPQLTNWIGDILSLIVPGECEVLRNCLTISVVAGFSTGFLFIFVREKPLSFADRILARLSGSVNPGGGASPEPVRFVPYLEALRIGDGKREYLNIEKARRSVNEWMIILQQTGMTSHPYMIDHIEQQLSRVQSILADENKKRKKNCRDEMLEVKWVCIVSKEGGFQAFQPYKTFCFHILVKHNARYAAILNTNTEQDLAKAIQTEIDLTQKYKITDATGTEREAFVPDAIPDLDKTWIRKGAANDEVLEVLIKENKGRAMLVSGCGSFEPIGVLTSTELAKLVLYEPLEDCRLYKPHVVAAEKSKLYGESTP